jgi:DNA topoisomerase-1
MLLIIAEKHDAAKRIAQILAGAKPKSQRLKGVETFQFDDKVVIGLSGHIVGVDYPAGYNNWQKVDCRDLIRTEIVKKPLQEKIISALTSLSTKADHITIATDFDREGELIGVEAFEIVQKSKSGLKADRVRYSAITKEEILTAFENPEEVDYDLAASGEARQIIDLIWGAVLTRFISLNSGRLGREFLSVGRVQSPTLALIVDREREIETFKPQTYWEIFVDLEKELRVQHAQSRIWKKSEVDKIVSKIGKHGVVKSIEKSIRHDKPPTPLDTTGFISAAASIGFSAANAMRIAEWLYTNGFISYPRTDNTVYPASINLRSIVIMLSQGHFAPEADKLLEGKMIPTRGKRSTTDHPPIYPTALANKKDLKDEQWKIYELVTRRFFATLADDCIWQITGLKVDIDGEPFRASGSRLIQLGWRYYYNYSKLEEHLLPELKKDERLQILGHEVLTKETQPPLRYGQGKLVKLMDELGLGTKSTRHDIISKLYARAYVHGNPLRPTNTAYAVVDTLQKYAPTIAKPEMTQILENDMQLIAENKIKEEDVIEKSRDMLSVVFKDLLKNKKGIVESLRNGLRTDKIVGFCERCGSELLIRRGRRGGRFIGCTGYPKCNFTLPLPRSGSVIVAEKLCDKHRIYHVRIIAKGKKPWDLGCPYCNYLDWKSKTPIKPKQKSRNNGLADVKGIGPKTLKRLNGMGIMSAKDLVKAEVQDLARHTGVSEKKIQAWQEAAKAMGSG